MKKIDCIFVRRHFEKKFLVADEINPGCEWVFNGEGVATIKWDGTAVYIDENLKCYQRYQVKPARNKAPIIPEGSMLCDEKEDRTLYWIPATDKWIIEAYNGHKWFIDIRNNQRFHTPGTYEAIGPKINGNRYNLSGEHVLIRHGIVVDEEEPARDFQSIKKYLKEFKSNLFVQDDNDCFHEGLVYHHPDGRMAKIRRADFGFTDV